MKKVIPFAILAALALSACSCAWFQKSGTKEKLIDCAEQSIQAQIPALISQVGTILGGGAIDYAAALDAFVAASGDAAICAIKVAVANLETLSAATQTTITTDSPPRLRSMATSATVQLVRGHVYLEHLRGQGFSFKKAGNQ